MKILRFLETVFCHHVTHPAQRSMPMNIRHILLSAVLLACASARATPIVENILSVLPVGVYEGVARGKVCVVEVSVDPGQAAGINVKVIDENETPLAFDFEEDVHAPHVTADAFGVGQAFVEYTRTSDDGVTSPLVKQLNVRNGWVTVKVKRKGLFTRVKSRDCQLAQTP